MISVPAEPFVRLLDEYLDGYDNKEKDYEAVVQVLARKLDMTPGVLTRMRSRGREPGARMSFDRADRILCALRLVHYWHTKEEYSAIYIEVELERNCDWCGERFETTVDSSRHCSKRCSESTQNSLRDKKKTRVAA